MDLPPSTKPLLLKSQGSGDSEIGLKSAGRRLYAVKMSASGTKIVKLTPITKRSVTTDPDGDVIASGSVRLCGQRQ